MSDPTARYKIRAEDDSEAGWRSALRTADKNSKRLKSFMASSFAGFVSVNAFQSIVGDAIKFGDEIGKAAVKAGTGAGTFSELAAALKQIGDVEMPSVSTALKFMQVNISKAREDNKKYGDTFRALGIDLTALFALSPDRQFEELADAISKLRDPADRARAATELFGKAGADLLPAFEDGARGIRKAREEAARFGHTLSDEAVKSLQEGDAAIKRLAASWGAFGRSLAVSTVELGQVLDLINKDQIGEWQDQLASVRRDMREATMPADGGVFDPKLYAQLAMEAQKFERLIANAQQTYARGGGSRRGSDNAAPGYGASPVDLSATDRRLNVMSEFAANIKYFEEIDARLQEDIATAIKSRQDLMTAVDQGINEGIGDTLRDTDRSLQELSDRLVETKSEWSTFADEAARNMQGAFADFLFDPFEGGIKGMARGFADVIRRMLAEAAAAKIFETLFGKKGGSGGGGAGDLFGTFLGAMFGSFGGGKAAGGPLQSGKWYVAGEKGPEPIWGGGAGAFAAGYPSGGGGGEMSFSVVINNDNRGASVDLMRRLPEHDRRLAEQIETTIVQKLKRRQYNLG